METWKCLFASKACKQDYLYSPVHTQRQFSVLNKKCTLINSWISLIHTLNNSFNKPVTCKMWLTWTRHAVIAVATKINKWFKNHKTISPSNTAWLRSSTQGRGSKKKKTWHQLWDHVFYVSGTYLRSDPEPVWTRSVHHVVPEPRSCRRVSPRGESAHRILKCRSHTTSWRHSTTRGARRLTTKTALSNRVE